MTVCGPSNAALLICELGGDYGGSCIAMVTRVKCLGGKGGERGVHTHAHGGRRKKEGQEDKKNTEQKSACACLCVCVCVSARVAMARRVLSHD